VELAAWQQYASGVYLDKGLTFDRAVRNFSPFAKQFAKDRYNFLSSELNKSVLTGYGKDMTASGLWGLGSLPYVGRIFQATSVALTVENNVGTVMAAQAYAAESRELMNLTFHGPQVFRVPR
jgi:hypothetical protein